MIDIIYSILAHESPESLDNLIDNLFKFNQNYQIKIILHLNENLFKSYQNNKVIINPIYYDKKINHSSLLKGHLENFDEIKKICQFKYFIPIASNCLMIKPMNFSFLNDKFIFDNYFGNKKENILKNHQKDWGLDFLKNLKLIDFLKEKRIMIYKSQLEGAILPCELLDKIYHFIYQNKIFDLITCETKFEEILIPTLEKFFTNKFMPRICKVYWNNPEYQPTLENIQEELLLKNHIFMVKRIPRNLNHPLRLFINELT